MMSAPPAQYRAALLGDLVASRHHEAQADLLRALDDALSAVNRRLPALQPLQITIGDEFQAVYEEMSAALEASLLVRLQLSATCDVRFGLGWGEISTPDLARAPYAQSGRAWWNAREALEEVAATTKRQSWPRGLRTRVMGLPEEVARPLNAYLLCRDELVSGMDERDCAITLGLLQGRTQSDIASELAITQPAVAQRQAASGAAAVLRSEDVLRGREP